MPKSVNKVTLMGHLGRDAETKKKNDYNTVWLNLATTEWQKISNGANDEYTDRTIWHRIHVTGKLADKAMPLLKGDYIYVEGALSSYEYENQSGGRQTINFIKARDIIPWVPKERKQEPVSNMNSFGEAPF